MFRAFPFLRCLGVLALLLGLAVPGALACFADDAGNLLSVAESALGGAANVAYTYDALHRALTEKSNGATHSYRYDLAGNRLGVQYGLSGGGNGRLVTSAYDTLNRLSTLTEGTRLTVYGYDLDGNVVAKTLPNGDIVSQSYDGLNRVYEEQGASAQGVLYHYLSLDDAVGNLKTSQEYTAGVAPRTVTLGYDAADRLTSELITNPSPVAGGDAVTASSTIYSYDNANNRAQKVANGVTTTYSYNNLNQLTGWSDTAGNGASYTYDFNGNRATRTVGAAADTYGYDTENRLVSLVKSTSGGSGSYSYAYDYRTRRVSRTESGNTTQLVFSGGTSVQEYTAPGTPSVEYVRGSDWGGGVGGVLYSMRSGTASFAHYDHRGDVTARTDITGTVTWQASYEAFGTRPSEYGTTQDRQKANTKEEDPTGLLDEGMRYRDLETGTFITRDPAGFVDGPNLYAYVRQNPWTKFDPEGLDTALLDHAPIQNPYPNANAATNTAVGVATLVTGPARAFASVDRSVAGMMTNPVARAQRNEAAGREEGGATNLEKEIGGNPHSGVAVAVKAGMILAPGVRAAGSEMAMSEDAAAAANATRTNPTPKGSASETVAESQAASSGSIPHLEGNVPDAAKWIKKGGSVEYHPDGSMTYTNREGIAVTYSNTGYPQFKEAGLVRQEVDINMRGNYTTDPRAANAAAPLGPKQPDNTWHHHENGTTMQEIDSTTHSNFPHSGGVSKNSE